MSLGIGRTIGGTSLIIGAFLYTVAEFIKAGGSPSGGSIETLQENVVLSHSMAQLSIAGLLLTLFGLYTAITVYKNETYSHFLGKFGLIVFAMGFLGFIFANGLDHITLHVLDHEGTREGSDVRTLAYALFDTKGGLVVVSASLVLIATALLAFSLSMLTSSRFQSNVARGMAVVGIAGLVLHQLASHWHTDTLYQLTGMSTLLVAAWFVVVGVGLIRSRE